MRSVPCPAERTPPVFSMGSVGEGRFGRPPKKALGFFGFHQPKRRVSWNENPRVVGSIPTLAITTFRRRGNLKSGDGGRRAGGSLWAHGLSRGYHMLTRGWCTGRLNSQNAERRCAFRGPPGAREEGTSMSLVRRSVQGWPNTGHTAAFEETAPSTSISTKSSRTARASPPRGRPQDELVCARG